MFAPPDLKTRATDPRSVLPVHTQPSFFQPAWGSQALITVTQDNVFGLPGANYCANLIARAVATIGSPCVYDGSGNEIPAPLLISRPVAGQGTFNTYQEITRALLMHGNWVAMPVGDQLLPLPMNLTHIYLNPEGRIRFDCGDLKLGQSEVVHIAANTTAGGGGIGVGVLNQFIRAFGSQLDQQSFVSGTYRNNGIPPAILHVDVDELTAAQAKESADAWTLSRDGRGVAVMSKKMSLETVAWKPEDMELLESRKFSIAELAMIFGISPAYLSASLGSSMTYDNAMSARSGFVNESVGPYLQVIEEGLSDVLPGNDYCRFEVEKYLRMTVAERDAHYTAALAGGWMTVEMVQKLEGLA